MVRTKSTSKDAQKNDTERELQGIWLSCAVCISIGWTLLSWNYRGKFNIAGKLNCMVPVKLIQNVCTGEPDTVLAPHELLEHDEDFDVELWDGLGEDDQKLISKVLETTGGT